MGISQLHITHGIRFAALRRLGLHKPPVGRALGASAFVVIYSTTFFRYVQFAPNFGIIMKEIMKEMVDKILSSGYTYNKRFQAIRFRGNFWQRG
jgi:hypothetical protein